MFFPCIFLSFKFFGDVLVLNNCILHVRKDETTMIEKYFSHLVLKFVNILASFWKSINRCSKSEWNICQWNDKLSSDVVLFGSLLMLFPFNFICQSAGLPWTVAKGQDTFTPISSVVRNYLFFLFLFPISYLLPKSCLKIRYQEIEFILIMGATCYMCKWADTLNVGVGFRNGVAWITFLD